MSVTILDTRDIKVKYQVSYLHHTPSQTEVLDLCIQYNVTRGIYDDIHIRDTWGIHKKDILSHLSITEGKERSDTEGDRGSRVISKLGMTERGKALTCTREF